MDHAHRVTFAPISTIRAVVLRETKLASPRRTVICDTQRAVLRETLLLCIGTKSHCTPVEARMHRSHGRHSSVPVLHLTETSPGARSQLHVEHLPNASVTPSLVIRGLTSRSTGVDALLSHFVCDIHLGRGTDSGLSTAACGFDIPATGSRDGGSFPVKQLTVSRATVRYMASQTRPSLWRRTRFAVAQEDRVCTCFTRNAAEDCTPLRRRSSLTHHFERSGVEALRGSQTVPGGPTTPTDGSP